MNKKIKLLVAILLSVFGIYFAFKGENFDTLAIQIKSVKLKELTFAVLLLILSCIPRAIRWKQLMQPFDSIPFSHVFSATMIGYFGNGVLVFRLGEFLKAYAVSKKYRITASQAFGTVIVERMLDLLMVFVILLTLVPWFPFYDNNIKVGTYASISVLLLSLIVIISIVKYNVLKKISSFKIFGSNFGKSILKALNKVLEGVSIIRNNNNIISIILISIILWFMYYMVTLLVLSACDINLSVFDIGVLLVLSSFLLGIPALPGSAGTLDIGVKYVLMYIFNITSVKALNYSIISHAVSYFPLLIIGFMYFLISNVSISDIKKRKFDQ